MSHDENKAFLRRVPLFSSLTEAQIDMLARRFGSPQLSQGPHDRVRG